MWCTLDFPYFQQSAQNGLEITCLHENTKNSHNQNIHQTYHLDCLKPSTWWVYPHNRVICDELWIFGIFSKVLRMVCIHYFGRKMLKMAKRQLIHINYLLDSLNLSIWYICPLSLIVISVVSWILGNFSKVLRMAYK